MKKKAFSGFTKKTSEHLLLDAGAFFKNFIYEPGGDDNDTFDTAVEAGKLIGATKGGGEFSAVPEVRQIEVDGVKGRAAGLEVIDSWEVYIKATILETTTESIRAALCAAQVDGASDEKYDIIEGKSAIDLADYVDNVTWIGNLSGSDNPVIIQVFNALSTDGLKINVQDKAEATIPVTFYGHYDQENLSAPPFRIFYPKSKAAKAAQNTERNSDMEQIGGQEYEEN